MLNPSDPSGTERVGAFAVSMAFVFGVGIALWGWCLSRPGPEKIPMWEPPAREVWPESAWLDTPDKRSGAAFVSSAATGSWEAEATQDDLIYLTPAGTLTIAPSCTVFVTDAAGTVPLVRFTRKADGRWHVVLWHGCDVAADTSAR